MLGHELRRLRSERGMSKAALARLSGISRSQLYAIEDGESQRPYVETLIDLAKGLASTSDGKVDEEAWADAFERLEVAAGYVKDAPVAAREVPDQLQARFNAIAQNWPRMATSEREHVVQLLSVVSRFGQAKPVELSPSVNESAEESSENTYELNLDWDIRACRTLSRPSLDMRIPALV